MAVPDLRETFAPVATNPDGTSINRIGLIGRDFLRHTRFSYDGPTGEFRLEVDLKNLTPSR